MKNNCWSMLSMTAFKMSIAAALLLAYTSPVMGQDVTTAKGGSSAAENDAIVLKREVVKLKREVARLKEQLEIAEHNGFYWAGKKAVGSPLALLKGLPRELQLKRNTTWDKFDLADVNEHLSQSRGQTYAARVTTSMTIKESDQRGVFDVSIRFSESKFVYNGHSFSLLRHGSNIFKSYDFSCGRETVEKLKKINLRKPVPVSAVISRVSLNGKRFYLTLKDIKLDRIELP